MKKKIIITGILLTILAVVITACKLPASGTPPPVLTETQTQPTATTGIAAEATNTSAPPPTAVLVTVTSVPPTAVVATSVPPTAVPPPPATQPSASRIQFASGATSASIEGIVDSGQSLYYV